MALLIAALTTSQALIVSAAGLAFALCVLGLLAVNLWQLFRYLQLAKLHGPATRVAKVGWILSAFGMWTGPLVPIFSVTGLILGASRLRSTTSPSDRLASRLAVINGAGCVSAITILVIVVLLVVR